MKFLIMKIFIVYSRLSLIRSPLKGLPVVEYRQLGAALPRGRLPDWRITAGDVAEVDRHHPVLGVALDAHHLGVLVPDQP